MGRVHGPVSRLIFTSLSDLE
ncbi:uncharacterized protein G2W53_010484 [Senna tora]|uniref:Uncharacterized protein n=1 Tax=Senna tora TaxID=362788 RepID=A0A834WZC7_9FABA|nr:uncharacterized protein G2W53_010484 [Senna tora]